MADLERLIHAPLYRPPYLTAQNGRGDLVSWVADRVQMHGKAHREQLKQFLGQGELAAAAKANIGVLVCRCWYLKPIWWAEMPMDSEMTMWLLAHSGRQIVTRRDADRALDEHVAGVAARAVAEWFGYRAQRWDVVLEAAQVDNLVRRSILRALQDSTDDYLA